MDSPAAQPAAPRKPRRRWLRYSLRTLFIATTIICIWVAFKVNAARRQREALAVITASGAYPGFDYQLVPVPGKPGDFTWNMNTSPPGPKWLREWLGEEYFREIVGVTISRPPAAADLAPLAKLPTLRVLSAINTQAESNGPRPRRDKGRAPGGGVASLIGNLFNGGSTTTLIGDATLEEIGQMTALDSLYLDYNHITDDGLRRLQNLGKLESLSLSNTDITGSGLRCIKSKHLKHLNLANTDLDDVGIESIAEMTSLQALDLSSTNVTDVGVAQLGNLAKLRNLNLSDTGITGAGLQHLNSKDLDCLNLRRSHLDAAGMEHLAKFTNLKTLLINQTQITDDGLPYLRKLTNLETLNLDFTKISDDGIPALNSLTKLKLLVLRNFQLPYTYSAIYELQKSLPSTKISAEPVLSPPPATSAEPLRRRTGIMRLPRGVEAATAPLNDDSGARWKTRLPPTNRKQNLLGRPSNISASTNLFPYQQYLIHRDLVTGRASLFEPIQAPTAIRQFVASRSSGCACLLALDDVEYANDILYFGRTVGFGDPWIKLSGHTEPPWWLLMSPGPLAFSQRLISCSDDASMRLWVIGDMPESITLPGPNGLPGWPVRIWAGIGLAKFPCYGHDANGGVTRGEFAAFSPYGQWLATSFKDKVSFRSPKDGTEQFAWDAKLPDGQRIMAIRFDASGTTLFAFLENALNTDEATMKFLQYDLDKRQAQHYIGTHGVIDGHATDNNKFVITWDGSPNVVFWDQSGRKELAVIQVAPEHVYDVAFSPAGDVMATGGDDGEAKLWKVADQTRIETPQRFLHEGIDLIQFSADGKTLFTGSDDGWLKAWTAPDFTWDRRPQPTQTEYRGDGTLIETFPDGSVKTSKKR